MKYLGIDFGLKKVGIAVSEGALAEPFRVIRYKDINTLIGQLIKIIKEEEIEKVVVGVSEGEMGRKSKEFGLSLKKVIDLSVENYDETLSTWEAQKLSIEGGVGRKKRHQFEDAFAASLVLQSYLDNKKNV
ncbi:Holliday junction resolvase RuvX [Candidatus Woesebacteria bacterium]|nr:Holliday junction resolvase RuvX [Candidatus Woesebacteria bacterium]